ncbi:MAG: hypothetical protein GOV15_02485, partial [Candidatus Diapherotrites archaeon]|nr:hypothetical protein [Candidatus Diapherotrites archaeon]
MAKIIDEFPHARTRNKHLKELDDDLLGIHKGFLKKNGLSLTNDELVTLHNLAVGSLGDEATLNSVRDAVVNLSGIEALFAAHTDGDFPTHEMGEGILEYDLPLKDTKEDRGALRNFLRTYWNDNFADEHDKVFVEGLVEAPEEDVVEEPSPTHEPTRVPTRTPTRMGGLTHDDFQMSVLPEPTSLLTTAMNRWRGEMEEFTDIINNNPELLNDFVKLQNSQSRGPSHDLFRLKLSTFSGGFDYAQSKPQHVEQVVAAKEKEGPTNAELKEAREIMADVAQERVSSAQVLRLSTLVDRFNADKDPSILGFDERHLKLLDYEKRQLAKPLVDVEEGEMLGASWKKREDIEESRDEFLEQLPSLKDEMKQAAEMQVQESG